MSLLFFLITFDYGLLNFPEFTRPYAPRGLEPWNDILFSLLWVTASCPGTPPADVYSVSFSTKRVFKTHQVQTLDD